MYESVVIKDVPADRPVDPDDFMTAPPVNVSADRIIGSVDLAGNYGGCKDDVVSPNDHFSDRVLAQGHVVVSHDSPRLTPNSRLGLHPLKMRILWIL